MPLTTNPIGLPFAARRCCGGNAEYCPFLFLFLLFFLLLLLGFFIFVVGCRWTFFGRNDTLTFRLHLEPCHRVEPAVCDARFLHNVY